MKELAFSSALGSGAIFRRADLHVHTPASDDMDSEWDQASPDDVVSLALEAGLELIAVTDHNTAAWCDGVAAAASETGLTVLPGVEISTSEGHLLAIFDVGKPQAEVEDFLISIGIRRDDLGNLHKIANGGLDQIAWKVEHNGGLAIAAHIERDKGFWSMMATSKARRKEIHASPNIRAYEIIDPGLRKQFRDGSLTGYERSVATVQGSDCYPAGGDSHQLSSIGARHCYIALDQPSLTGIRMACLDPDIRIRFMDDERPEPNSAIEGLWVSGGFLSEQVFRFSDSISCLIGDTGSGKSLMLELLRFALDQQVSHSVLPNIAEEVANLLTDNLDEMGTVHVLIRKDGDRYLVERPWLGRESESLPTVARVIDGALVTIDDQIHMPTFFPMKGFSQTEIIEYAREPLARLSLIDDLLDLATELTIIEEIKSQLRENAAQITNEMQSLETTQQQLKDLPGIQEEIKRLGSFLTNETVRSRGAWDPERSVLDSAADAIEDLKEQIKTGFPDLDDHLIHEDDLDEKTPSTELQDQLMTLDSEIRNTLAKAERDLQSELKPDENTLRDIRADWETTFKKADDEYTTLIANLDTKERNQAKLQAKLTELGRMNALSRQPRERSTNKSNLASNASRTNARSC